MGNLRASAFTASVHFVAFMHFSAMQAKCLHDLSVDADTLRVTIGSNEPVIVLKLHSLTTAAWQGFCSVSVNNMVPLPKNINPISNCVHRS